MVTSASTGSVATEGIPAESRRRVRTILLIGFGGLLAIMLAAGFIALGTLRDLHAAEETARRDYLRRSQALTTVTFSIHGYSDQVEQYLLSREMANRQAAAANEMARFIGEAQQALSNYPGGLDPIEQQLIQNMQRQLAAQQQAVQTLFSWTPDERRRRGPIVVQEELIPWRLHVLENSEQIALLNRQRLDQTNTDLILQFGVLRQRLTLMIVLALGAGLLLSLLSAAYISRLENQAENRYQELARNQREMAELSARLVDAQEAERRTISRELHDEVGQSLGALLVDVAQLRTLVPSDNVAQDQLTRIKNLAEGAVRTVRNMALLLRPSMLDDLGLIAALEWQGREISRHGDMEVEVRADNVSEKLPDEYSTCIYRLVQEALNNAARHAGARNAHVTVTQTPDQITIMISDDGRGFDPKRVRGLGLVGMEERVRRLGGTLTIDSQPGKGTTLQAVLPLAKSVPPEIHEEHPSTAGRRS